MTGEQHYFGVSLMVFVVVVSSVGGGALATAAADGQQLPTQQEPPDEPASYFGEIQLNGEPAPPGTTITAEIDGEQRGSIVVEEPGQYGEGAVGGDKLIVDGTSEDEGKAVTFLVNGVEVNANPAVTFETADVQEVDLSGSGFESNFEVDIDGGASETSVFVGQTATVVAEVENTGSIRSTETISFEVGGTVEAERSLDLGVGESQQVSFEVPLNQVTTTQAVVASPAGSDSVELVAEERPDPPQARLSVSSQSPVVGEPVTLNASASTPGERRITAYNWEVGGERLSGEQVTTRFDDPGEYDVRLTVVNDAGLRDRATTTLTVTDRASFEVSEFTVPEEADTGETVDVSATVTNVGGLNGTQTVSYEFAGEQIAQEALTLAPGGERALEFEVTVPDDPGEYEHVLRTANESRTETTTAAEALLEVRALDAPRTASPGDGLSVSATIVNAGNLDDSQEATYELVVAGETTFDFSSAVSLGPGESQTLQLTAPTTEQPGAYRHVLSTDDDTATALTIVTPGNQSIPVDRGELEDTPEGGTFQGSQTALRRIGITTNVTGSVAVTQLSQVPAGVPPVPGEPGTILEIFVPQDATNESATIEVTAPRSVVDEAGGEPSDYTLQRFVGDGWKRVDATVSEVTDEAVRLTGNVSGFSLFAASAVGEPTADFETSAPVTVGEELTLDAGPAATQYGNVSSFEWTVGGETLSGEEASITLDEAGEVEVSLTVENDAGLTDTATQTVTVSAEQGDGGTETDGDSLDDDGDGSGDGLGPGFGAVAALIGLLAVALLAYRRRER